MPDLSYPSMRRISLHDAIGNLHKDKFVTVGADVVAIDSHKSRR